MLFWDIDNGPIFWYEDVLLADVFPYVSSVFNKKEALTVANMLANVTTK